MIERPDEHGKIEGSQVDIGATMLSPSIVKFRVWSPQTQSVSVRIVNSIQQPIQLSSMADGWWEGTVEDLSSGAQYLYVLNDKLERPDPASRFQPEGVHGASEVVDSESFYWTDQNWLGPALEQYIIYELHTGTFTNEGTFNAIIPALPYLRDEVGINAIEIMPVAQFPGARNWGYDGSYLFAPQNTYGGPEGLKSLVDACHSHGLAVIMDVVYNHLGPEGNYLGDFGPYFTDVYRTPWGSALNYDGPNSDGVRHFIVSNAVYWIKEFHIDALRLDAIHGIFDFSAKHILQEIGEAVHAEGRRLGREAFVIAESDLNDSRIISPPSKGGYGLDGQWSDDFHHALHSILTQERRGYYEDFGKLQHMATAIKDRFVYAGHYSHHRQRRHGNSVKHCLPSQFVVYAQNHDQIGNRAQGDRLTSILCFEAQKVSTASVLLSPNIPLLFMGEEYGETAPFLYFIDHGDPSLKEAVKQGRRREFSDFEWSEIPDPSDVATFNRSKLTPHLGSDRRQKYQLDWCRALIHLRKSVPALGIGTKMDKLHVKAHQKSQSLIIHRKAQKGAEALILLGFNSEHSRLTFSPPPGTWKLCLDSGAKEFGGNDQHPSAPSLIVPEPKRIEIELPSYPAWLYLNTE